jgi:nucleotide-binding universal stress UspA family protein
MTAVATPIRSDAPAHADHGQPAAPSFAAPIVAAVESSAASRAAVETAVRLGAELDAPLVFVYVRPGPAGFLGGPVYQLRLTAAMARARRVLARALRAASRAGVAAEAEILEGSPRRRILEFARERGARLVVVGRRRRRLGRSVSCAVVRAARRPVVVAQSVDPTPDATAVAKAA